MSKRLSCLACVLVGCASLKPMPLTTPPNLDWSDTRTHAGIAQADITPPLGLGMFGHGPEGRVAVGTQLRLRCQTFVIVGAAPTGKRGEVIALVPCDLSSPSLLLQREIAKRVADANVPIGANAILLMATHTHAAPGNFYGVKNYIEQFSTRVLGFDPRVLDFLATRISCAIIEAYHAAQATPVRLSWSQDAVTAALTRNRDPDPMLQDHKVPEWLEDRVQSHFERAEEGGVDPTMSVLRIDKIVPASKADAPARYEPYGLFATFAMHPSALSNTNTFYSGDIFGYAARYITDAVRASAKVPSFVVGIANGIEGDVMPNRTIASMRESRRFGHRLAAEIKDRWQKLDAAPSTDPDTSPVHVAYRELNLASAATRCGDMLCDRPGFGTASGGGANDHPTLMRAFPQVNPGAHTLVTGNCGYPKLPVLAITGKSTAGEDYPGVAPITVAQIGTHYLVTMPAEVTTMTGVRVREAVADELKLPAVSDKNVGRNVVVIGLTNEYLQYVATREEYQLQYYEGASTLYGPASADFLRDHAACLAHWLAHQEDAKCRLGQTRDVNAVGNISHIDFPDAHLISDVKQDTAVQLTRLGNIETKTTRDGLVQVELRFKGPEPRRLRSRNHLWVQVREVAGDKLIEDDLGTTVTTQYDYDKREWIASYIPDLPEAGDCRCGQALHFVVGSGKSTIDSGAFTLDCSNRGSLSKVWP